MTNKELLHKIVLLTSLSLILCTGCQSQEKNIIKEETSEANSEISTNDKTKSNNDSNSISAIEEDTTPETLPNDSDSPSSDEIHFTSFELGETEQKDGWTQTYVYPNNIDDTFVIDALLPDDYDTSKSYPVVYLTDCYWRRENYLELKKLYTSGTTQEFILIGIGYPDDYDFDTIRERDLIYHPDQFLDMIINGVLPYAESNYSIDTTNRTFCGASHGGYFMCYSLLQSNGLTKDIFKNYVLASPSLYEISDVLYLPMEEDKFLAETSDLPLNIYMSVGGAEDVPYTIRPAEKFVRHLEEKNYPNLNITFKEYEGLGHYEVWVPTLLDGLSMFLNE